MYILHLNKFIWSVRCRCIFAAEFWHPLGTEVSRRRMRLLSSVGAAGVGWGFHFSSMSLQRGGPEGAESRDHTPPSVFKQALHEHSVRKGCRLYLKQGARLRRSEGLNVGFDSVSMSCPARKQRLSLHDVSLLILHFFI